MDSNFSTIAQDIVLSNVYLTLATTNGVKPWSSTVFYCVDENYNFYFISKLESKHIQNITKQPSVSFSIFNSHQPEGEGNGVQGSGIVVELEGSELVYGLLHYKTTFIELTPDNLAGEAPYRLFKLITGNWFILNPDAETDERIEVKM